MGCIRFAVCMISPLASYRASTASERTSGEAGGMQRRRRDELLGMEWMAWSGWHGMQFTATVDAVGS